MSTIEKEHQVHIRAVIQLVAAQLTERKYCEAGFSLSSLRIDTSRSTIAPRQAGINCNNCFLKKRIRQIRDFLGDFTKSGDACYIPKQNSHVFPLAEAGQRERSLWLRGTTLKPCKLVPELFR